MGWTPYLFNHRSSTVAYCWLYTTRLKTLIWFSFCSCRFINYVKLLCMFGLCTNKLWYDCVVSGIRDSVYFHHESVQMHHLCFKTMPEDILGKSRVSELYILLQSKCWRLGHKTLVLPVFGIVGLDLALGTDLQSWRGWYQCTSVALRFATVLSRRRSSMCHKARARRNVRQCIFLGVNT